MTKLMEGYVARKLYSLMLSAESMQKQNTLTRQETLGGGGAGCLTDERVDNEEQDYIGEGVERVCLEWLSNLEAQVAQT